MNSKKEVQHQRCGNQERLVAAGADGRFHFADQEPLLLSRQGHGSEDQLCGREPIRGHAEKMRTDASEIKKKKAEENLHFSTLKR